MNELINLPRRFVVNETAETQSGEIDVQHHRRVHVHFGHTQPRVRITQMRCHFNSINLIQSISIQNLKKKNQSFQTKKKSDQRGCLSRLIGALTELARPGKF